MREYIASAIGKIGPASTFQNGGYRSHLHIGIVKATIENALIAGYHDNVEHWYNPIQFIPETEKNKTPRLSPLLFLPGFVNCS